MWGEAEKPTPQRTLTSYGRRPDLDGASKEKRQRERVLQGATRNEAEGAVPPQASSFIACCVWLDGPAAKSLNVNRC